MNNRIKLVKGKALIIRGAEGSGKSILAIETAKAHGKFIITSGSRLNHPSGLIRMLFDEPNTIILEETKIDDYVLSLVKYYISSDSIDINNRKYKTPNFILCTGDKDPIPLSKNDRRFTVVDL